MQFSVVLERADDGSISVWVPDLTSYTSSGVTRDEALASITRAIRGQINLHRERGESVQPPR